MSEQRTALRAALGRVGIWSFALQTHPAAGEQAAARAYEALGYRSTWFPESIGSKEAFAHAGLLLAGTDRLVVGTGIANIYARDAMAMVGGANTLAEAYPSRFVLGIGVSHAPSVSARGSVYEKPVQRMGAYLDAMDAATYAGPAPAVPAPVLLAALGPRMLELAAMRTAGAHPYFVPVEHTAMARGVLGPDPVLVVEQAAVLETDRTKALEIARAFAVRYVAMPNYANNLRRLGWADDDIANGGSDLLLDAIVVQGDAATIAARVRSHLDAGADHVCIQIRAADPGDLAFEAFGAVREALGDLVG